MNIGIPEKNRRAVAIKLQTLLADEFVLYTKTRSSHWNVEGINFTELHKLYEKQYKALEIIIDDVAERIRTLGFYSPGTLSDMLKHTRLKEEEVTNDPEKQLEDLLNDHESITRYLRETIPFFLDKHQDHGTADFITGILEQHEKTSWMLRSLLQQDLSRVVVPLNNHKKIKETA